MIHSNSKDWRWNVKARLLNIEPSCGPRSQMARIHYFTEKDGYSTMIYSSCIGGRCMSLSKHALIQPPPTCSST